MIKHPSIKDDSPAPPEQREGDPNAARWAVVGGGMMGLALAHRLTKDGQRVKVIEARPSLGGLADAWRLGDVVWDRHYHVILLSDDEIRALLQELGLEDEIGWIETKTGFYSGGQFYSMSNTWEFLKFPPLNLFEKLRLGATIFAASKIKNWKRMEEVLVEKWLRRWSGDSVFEKIWLPLLRCKLGEAYKRTSASFIWSYIARMYRARRTGHKKEMFGYVPGGYARILDTMNATLKMAGAEIMLNARIREIKSDAARGPEVHYDDGSCERFDHVVVTTPAPVVPKICPGLGARELKQFGDIEYLGIVCASVLLDRPLEGYYVTNITDEVPFTAVIEATTIVPPSELKGNTLVYLPKYLTQESPLFDASDEEIRSRFLAAFFRMYPYISEANVRAFQVSRVRNVMAIPTLGFSETLPPMGTSLPNVYVIGSSHILKGNLNVNETLGLAKEGYEKWLAPVICQSKTA